MEPRKKQPVTTGGAGYTPSWQINPYRLAIDIVTGGLPADTVRNRLYRNLRPVGYGESASESINRFKNAVNHNKNEDKEYDVYRDDVYALYLGIPLSQRRNTFYKLRKSNYKPSINSESDEYYALPLSNLEKDLVVGDAMKNSSMPGTFRDSGRPNYLNTKKYPPLSTGLNKLSNVLDMLLGMHTVGRGTDLKRGDYVSYYDKWDLSPIGWYGPDQSGGIGKPVNIYDRIYLDDYYGVDSSARPGTYYGGYLPEITVYPKKKK